MAYHSRLENISGKALKAAHSETLLFHWATGKPHLEMPLTLQKSSKCQSSSQPSLCLPPGMGSALAQVCSAQMLTGSWKKHPMRSLYLCFPNTPWSPSALVSAHCRVIIQNSQKLRALAACPRWAHPQQGLGRGITASLWVLRPLQPLPSLTEFLSSGRRARAFAEQWGASSTQSLDFCPGPLQTERLVLKYFWNPDLKYDRQSHKGSIWPAWALPCVLHIAQREAICWSSQTTQCQGHYSFHWQAAGCLQLCNQLRGNIPFHFYYQ